MKPFWIQVPAAAVQTGRSKCEGYSDSLPVQDAKCPASRSADWLDRCVDQQPRNEPVRRPEWTGWTVSQTGRPVDLDSMHPRRATRTPGHPPQPTGIRISLTTAVIAKLGGRLRKVCRDRAKLKLWKLPLGLGSRWCHWWQAQTVRRPQVSGR